MKMSLMKIVTHKHLMLGQGYYGIHGLIWFKKFIEMNQPNVQFDLIWDIKLELNPFYPQKKI